MIDSRVLGTIVVVCSALPGCNDGGEGDDDVGTGPCLIDGELGPLALRIEGDRAWILDGDLEIELDLMGPGTTSLLRGAGHGEVVGVARNTDTGSTLHAFDRTGNPSWSASFDGVLTNGLWVGPDGLAAGTAELLGAGPVGLVATQAGGVSLDAHVPIGGPVDGIVPVVELVVDSVYGQPGWFDLAAQSFTPVAIPPLDPYAVQFAKDLVALEYATAEGPGIAFVSARPGETLVIALPDGFSDMPQLVAAAGNYRVLRAGSSPQVFARVDLDLAEASLIDPLPPDGWEWFDCDSRETIVDPEGRVLFQLRSGSAARVWAYDVDANEWSELGLPMSGIEDIEFVASVGDLHVVRGIASGFCTDVEWLEAPPAEALLGQSLQVVRREPGLALELPAGSDAAPIDGGRRCVAYEEAQAWQVRALDGGEVADFAGGGSWIWIE